MAPSTGASVAAYGKDEEVFCFHHELLYDAKVLELRRTDEKDKTSPFKYRVHYKGWKNTWDDWVPQDRLRKFTEENKELAANLRRELVQQQPSRTSAKLATSHKKGKAQGSDLGSGRGSEERHSSVPAGGRGNKRNKDNDIEKVSSLVLRPLAPVSDTAQGHRIRTPGYDLLTGYPGHRPISNVRRSPKPVHRWSVRRKDTNKSLVLRPFAPESAMDKVTVPETAEEILDGPLPEDPREHITKRTKKAGQYWAPLLSGSTAFEKDDMDEELIAAGKMKRPADRYHPQYVKARQNDPYNLNRQLFFEGQDSSHVLSIAGVAKEPLQIDPPGSNTPFDALRYPDSLVMKLNRLPYDPDSTLRHWDIEAFKKIPADVMERLDPETLAMMPYDVLATMPTKVLNKLPALSPVLDELIRSKKVQRSSQQTRAQEQLRRFTTSSVRPSRRASARPRRVSARSRRASTHPPRRSLRSNAATSAQASTQATRHVPADEAAVQHLPPRRQPGKVKRACNRCRQARVKCDGGRPACTECVNKGSACSYIDAELSVPSAPDDDSSSEENDEDDDYDEDDDEEAPSSPAPDHGSPGEGEDNEDEQDLGASDFSGSMADTTMAPLTIVSNTEEQETEKHDDHHKDLGQLDQASGTQAFISRHPNPSFTEFSHVPKPTRSRDPRAYQNIPFLQEEMFHNRPSVRIVLPDHLKNLLVDDWENVTKSLLLVPLPSAKPVNFIIDTYFEEEKGNRRLGSAEADILEEVTSGLKTYFAVSLGKTLLYRFERNQYAEVRKLWESGKHPSWNGRGPGDAYGAEHLCRLLVSLPELIAQTNMDVQSVNKLREEISKFNSWLARNSGRFFCTKYDKPSAEYIEGAR